MSVNSLKTWYTDVSTLILIAMDCMLVRSLSNAYLTRNRFMFSLCVMPCCWLWKLETNL